ncbi:hypothetical protein [Cupriavidus gilardii]|uniref:hypothetical protein n=1 Tax=Cupriavidus gilardii TaxID=82541 RepID=UPI001574753F|nr:hypothetical protein [Cupriavidus gilardii]NSX02606.1 hypothetical protein [Cupriavidus gilardii]
MFDRSFVPSFVPSFVRSHCSFALFVPLLGDGMLHAVFRFFGPCLGVRHKERPDAAQPPRIARDAQIRRSGLWYRLLCRLFFWRGRRADPARTCRQPLPRIAYVSTPAPLSHDDTAKSLADKLAPLPPDALHAFCAGCRKDTLLAMVDWCRATDNDPATRATLEASAREALRKFKPDAVPAPGVKHVLTLLQRDLADVRNNKGVLTLARRRDDWVSRHPRDREFVAGGQHAADTFEWFRRSIEALCRFEMAGGLREITQSLAAPWADAADTLCAALKAEGATVAALAGFADVLRLQERDTALALIRNQLGIAEEPPQSSRSAGAQPDEAAGAARTVSGQAQVQRDSGPPSLTPTTLTDLLVDPGSDAHRAAAAVDLLVHNLRTVARLRAREAISAQIEQRLDDLLARTGACLTEPQLHRLGDALQRLDLKAWGTCRKLLDIREALYDTGKQALRDAMARSAGVRSRQAAVRAQAQQLWQSIGKVDAAVAPEAGPSGRHHGAAIG